MNGPTLFVLMIVILVIACSAFGTYRMVKNHSYCDGCPKKNECCCNPINCTLKK